MDGIYKIKLAKRQNFRFDIANQQKNCTFGYGEKKKGKKKYKGI